MKKVLIIEDEKFLSQILKVKLEQTGFEAHIANDGDEGEKLFKKINPDIVLLDIVMPNKNGFAFLESIKKQKNTSKAPIVILSNLEQEADIQRIMDLGAKKYLVKSNTPIKKVVKEVQAILEEQE